MKNQHGCIGSIGGIAHCFFCVPYAVWGPGEQQLAFEVGYSPDEKWQNEMHAAVELYAIFVVASLVLCFKWVFVDCVLVATYR